MARPLDKCTRLTNPTRTLNFEYDIENKARRIMYSNGGGNAVRYNAEGLRTELSFGTTTTDSVKFIYDGSTVIGQTNHTGGITTLFTPVSTYTVAGGVEIVNRENAQGSFIQWHQHNGLKEAQVEYDAYGKEVQLAGGYRSPYGWKGKHGYLLQSNGLELVGQRYYVPSIGRFLTRDPIDQDDGLNVYAYCGNDPINRIDPDGTDNEFIAGWGDSLTFGGTKIARKWLGGLLGIGDPNDSIDMNSGAYMAGTAVGTVHSMAITGLGGAQGVKAIAAYKNAGAAFIRAAEGAVGHVAERHIGKSLAYLAQRSASNGNRLMTSYTSSRHASAITEGMKANHAAIVRWMATNPRAGETLALKHTMSKGVGYGMQGRNSVKGLTNTKTVLQSNGRGSFDVLTSFPTR
jgi:RHS repeat-associated protein